ncbi:MAG: hypothetical protein ACW97A_05790 [Candidatus Thorarchaeota archaeon]|jgi:hypothetical protein
MLPEDWESSVRGTIEKFPDQHREFILRIWFDWLETNPESPFYQSWTEYSSKEDDQEALYTDTRVYLKRVANELREKEIPPTNWQKIAKALAAVASIILVVFLALSRVARASD